MRALARPSMMAELPQPIQRLDDLLAAATIAHEYVADAHRELVELQADDAHTRGLLQGSAAVILEEMPRLTREFREEEGAWDRQRLLDPQTAEQMLAVLASRIVRLEPTLEQLRARQDEIAAEMLKRVESARET
jgi:hypothetical protein